MFVGHYGISFAAKSVNRRVPLWVLFVAVQLLDVLWAPLILLGVEKVRIVPGITATNPLDLYYMPYTHSLIAAVLWSLAALVVYRAFTNDRGPAALVVALAVFSHWVLDLVVHRPDLPLYDDTWKVGFGLWNRPALALASEAALLAIGVALYLRTATSARDVWMTIGFALVMFGVHCFTFFGAPPSSPAMAAAMALVAYVAFAAAAFALERRSG
jgi:membrane-bound metal-dependent hydrolase YbcI (DUF457 family)